VAEAETGNVREVMGETVPKFFESGNGKINWHYLPGSNEILWFSERDDWGNLYLYDLATGKLKNQITHGPGNVTQYGGIPPFPETQNYVAQILGDVNAEGGVQVS